MIILILSALLSVSSHAQTPKQPHRTTVSAKSPAKPASTPAKTAKTDESTTDVIHVGTGNTTEQTMTALKAVPAQVAKEKQEIAKLKTTTKDSCALEELNLREQDAEFLEKNQAQIDEIIKEVQTGLRAQRKLLRDFESGAADGEHVGPVKNANGEVEESATIDFRVYNDGAVLGRKSITLKDLVRYIRKFEAEAKTIPDDSASVEAFLNRYRVPETENDPKYFNMTLEQALKAYRERLGSVFAVSYKEKQKREMTMGTGKNLFQIVTTTVLGYSPEHGTYVGSNKARGAKESGKVEVKMIQNFGQAFVTAKEDDYWSVIRDQEITIDGIPIDGLQRRKYFDEKRSEACQKHVTYTFNEKSAPGPFQDYSDKQECVHKGIEILSATVVSSKDSSQALFDFTKEVKANADGKFSYQVPALSTMIPRDQMRDDAQLQVTYRCGCKRVTHDLTQIESLQMKKTICGWGCGSAVNDHMVGWNFSEMAQMLQRAKLIYGSGVTLEVQTINDITGYNALSAESTVYAAGSNHGLSMSQADVRSILQNLRFVHVNSLPAAQMVYRWNYRLILPDGKTIQPDSGDDHTLGCPADD